MKTLSRNILFLLLFLCPILTLAKVSLQIDPPRVALGDSFRLIFTLDDAKAKGVPDLTPLEDNFKILGTERSMSYSIINGQSHSVSQWIIAMRAKKIGTLPIPALQFGQEQSAESQVEVTEEKDGGTPSPDDEAAALKDDVLIKTSFTPKDAYVNQQIIYTVKLYNSQRLLDADYTPPRVEDALLFPLGNGRRYQENVNGRVYAVEEQRYAIYPQKPGELKISPPSFNALVYDTIPRRVDVHAKTKHLEIKPRPAGYSGQDWLPAKAVIFSDTYDKDVGQLEQGQTLVRTINLQVTGVPAQLLPHLALAGSASFNAYPEKPVLKNRLRQQELVGQQEIKVTYLLNKAGPTTIPELRLVWFNTTTAKEEIAVLAARQLLITPKANAAPAVALQAQTNLKTAQANEKSKPVMPQGRKTGWILAAAFAFLWLMTLLAWFLQKTMLNGRCSQRQALKTLQRAIAHNNPQQTQTALLAWARLQWPQSTFINLSDVEQWIDDAGLKEQCALLAKVLYGKTLHGQWQGSALWTCLKVYLQRAPKSSQKKKLDSLPPINKIEH
jgi:hypothetical protein